VLRNIAASGCGPSITQRSAPAGLPVRHSGRSGARLPVGRRRDELISRIDSFFENGFPDQVLRFDRSCAALYGEIRHAREAAGKPITVEDAMIAATARAYGVEGIATRNTKDFVGCGVELINPWAMHGS
jgi:toxin FitB